MTCVIIPRRPCFSNKQKFNNVTFEMLIAYYSFIIDLWNKMIKNIGLEFDSDENA